MPSAKNKITPNTTVRPNANTGEANRQNEEGSARGSHFHMSVHRFLCLGPQPTHPTANLGHGGFVTYVGHDNEGTAFLTMGGGCHGCSMSRMTMLEGVQTMILEKVPGVERVRDLTDHTTGENPFYH